jgi:hypothetical protein
MATRLKPIDWKIFEKLCNIQCTAVEMAAFLEVDNHTLYDRTKREYGEEFPEVYKRFSQGGKCSLRRMQWQLASKNVAMAIWLGKQHLGQREPQAIEVTTPPKKEEINYEHMIMHLKNEIAQLKESVNREKYACNE